MTLDFYPGRVEELEEVPVGLRFCGRSFSGQELEWMREMARDYAGLAVTEMARTVCELLEWKRANGRLKDQECRQLLEYLRDQGWLRLPPVRSSGPRGPRHIPLTEASAPQAQVEGSAGEFEPLQMQLVESREESQLWTELIERHHYLRYRVPVGANLRYLVRFGQKERSVLACLLWSSPAWKMQARDEWIGWSDKHRGHNLQSIVNNGRFSDFALGASPRTGQQDSGAERTANAARLGDPLRVSASAAGNLGGCETFSRNLLPRRQLDPCGTNRRTRSYGPGARRSRSSSQGYLRLSAGA